MGALNHEWVERTELTTPKRPIALDIYSSESPTDSEQEDSAYGDASADRQEPDSDQDNCINNGVV